MELKEGMKVCLLWSSIGNNEYVAVKDEDGCNLVNVITHTRYDGVEYPTFEDLMNDLENEFKSKTIHQIEIGGKIWKTRL